jgi:hypothetical protein
MKMHTPCSILIALMVRKEISTPARLIKALRVPNAMAIAASTETRRSIRQGKLIAGAGLGEEKKLAQ